MTMPPRFSLPGLLIAALTLASQPHLRAQEMAYVHGDRYVTPHARWSDPQDGPPLDVLFISPANGSRDAWDLAQRMPIRRTVFEINSARGKFGKPEMFGESSVRVGALTEYEHRRQALDALLDTNAYDVIVLGNVCWSSLPMSIVYKISEQAHRGAGVLMANARFDDPLIEKLYTQTPLGDGLDLFQPFPFHALTRAADWKAGMEPLECLDRTEPYVLPRGALTAWQVGRGRFVSLAFPRSNWAAWSATPALIPGCGINMRNLVQEDYYYALVCKALRWAAGRTPAARLTAVAPRGGEARPAGEPLEVDVTVLAPDGKPPFAGQLAVEVRDAVTGRSLGTAQTEVAVPAGATRVVTLAIGNPNQPGSPARLPGDAFIHARLLNAGRVTDFGVGHVKALPAASPVLTLDALAVNFRDPVAGVITLDATARVDQVTLELYDAQGRIWERRRVATPTPSTRFELPTESTRGIAHGIRATAFRGDRPAGVSDVFFNIQRPRESYYFHVSDEPWGTWHSLRRLGRAYEWGMDGLRNHKPCVPDALTTALAGVDMNPGRPHVTLDLALDPAQVDQLEVTGRTSAGLYQGFNQAIYNTSDDCGPRIEPINPTTLPRFTAWLQARHTNDIARLNAIWRTDFAAFEAIDVATIRAAKESGRVELWMDYCLFIHETYLNAQHRYRQAVQSVDPRPATGCDAIYYGHSLAGLFRGLGYIMPYYTPIAVEMGRSLGRSAGPLYTGICMGYGTHSPRPFHEYLPWHILFAGNNSILFWSLSAGFNGDLVAADTIRYRPGWMMGETGRIKLSGAGMFINASRRRPSGIAMLYSEASKRAEDVDAPLNSVEESALNFQELLFDQGLGFDYVSTESIVEDNVLADPALKLLVLPHAQVISADEAAQIRRFVERGGALLADVRPGIRDGLGRRGATGMLDDLFGIRQTNAPAAKIAFAFPGQTATVDTRADPGVVPRGAVPRLHAAGIPLWLEHRFGRGRALLLNHESAFLGVSPRGDAESATTAREAPPGSAAHAYFAERLASMGVGAPEKAQLDGAPPLGVKRIRFTRGDTELLAVEVKSVGGLKYPATLELDLGESRHVVEIRSGRDFGQTSMLKLSVQPYDILLFALLRQRPAPLVIEAPARLRAGAFLQATVRRPGAPASSLLHFALARPDGVLLRDYQKRVLTDGPTAGCKLPLPLNAPPGTWQLTVTDWVTQQRATVPVIVEGSVQP